MKNSLNITFLLYLFILPNNTNSQQGWFWQNPAPQANTLQDISFADDNNAIAVGNYGTIIKTSDGGQNWSNLFNSDGNCLYSVSYINENLCFAVGNNGTILRTTDGGIIWTKINSGTSKILNGVKFYNSNFGLAVGQSGTILRTIDAGQSWEKLTSITTNRLNSIEFLDANTAIVVGDQGKILKTIDSGNNWTSITSGTTNFLESISFRDSNNGMIVGGNYTILKTTDGGTNWELIAQSADIDLYSVCYASNENFCVIGGEAKWNSSYFNYESTVIIITDNGTKTLYNIANYKEVDFFGAANNILIGTNGAIYKTNDNGNTWSSQLIGSRNDIKGITFATNERGVAVGQRGTILQTKNAGVSWNEISYNSPTTNGSINDILYDVEFINSGNGIITGSSVMREGRILRTTNGGQYWSISHTSPRSYYNAVSYITADKLIAVGLYADGNWIFDHDEYSAFGRSTDGGSSWNGYYFSNHSDELTDVSFTNQSRGILIGTNGLIMQSTNGGANWNTLNSRTTKDLFGVYYSDTENVTVVGEDGTILRSYDGGSFWIEQSSGTNEDLYSVHFFNGDYGIISGAYGVVLKTTNGGFSWEKQNVRTDYDLYASFMHNELEMTIAGDEGTIMHTIDGGIDVNVENDAIAKPAGFELKQNYPNPFNPSTTIEYTIPNTEFGGLKSETVRLSVHDILGREIVVLINKQQSSGTYSVQWEASNISSGVYFYRISFGGFNQSKKMILLR